MRVRVSTIVGVKLLGGYQRRPSSRNEIQRASIESVTQVRPAWLSAMRGAESSSALDAGGVTVLVDGVPAEQRDRSG